MEIESMPFLSEYEMDKAELDYRYLAIKSHLDSDEEISAKMRTTCKCALEAWYHEQVFRLEYGDQTSDEVLTQNGFGEFITKI